MDIDMAVNISFCRLVRRSITGSPAPEATYGKPRPRPRVATVTLLAASTSPDEAALAALRQSLRILVLARSRLHHALAISEALH